MDSEENFRRKNSVTLSGKLQQDPEEQYAGYYVIDIFDVIDTESSEETLISIEEEFLQQSFS